MPNIKTKAELMARLQSRRTPVTQLVPTPSGLDMNRATHDAQNHNERRIQTLRNTLTHVREKTLHDHRLAQLKGRSRASFNPAQAKKVTHER